MKRRARRKPRTVLDRLEADGVIVPPLAKRLRSALKRDRPPSAGDCLLLLVALLQPDRRDARLARLRNFALALEHAYYKGTGEPAAIKRTAGASGVSRRTVSDAVRKSPRLPQFLVATIISMMRGPDSWRHTGEQDSIATIRRMMRESPQTTRSRELQQGLAALRKRIPAPRGRQ